MARRSNLIRRDGGTYYARIYIPSDLRDQFSSEDKKVSLRTKDEVVAKRRLNFELQKWDAEFEDMRARRQLTDEDTVDQVNALFRSPLFTGCMSDGAPRFWNKPGDVKVRDHRFWIPLIMLYSGARPGEIAQLGLSDVRQEQEAWIFDITETADDSDEDIKRLKTDSSRRVVPVHRELINLGFLDYLSAIRDGEHTRVFPLAIRNDRGQMLSDFSRDFGRYLEKVGLKSGRGLSLYSFRHGAFDAMRRAGYLDEQFNFIFGHVSGGNRVTKGYGVLTQGILEQRSELVNAIAYPGLDLGMLK